MPALPPRPVYAHCHHSRAHSESSKSHKERYDSCRTQPQPIRRQNDGVVENSIGSVQGVSAVLSEQRRELIKAGVSALRSDAARLRAVLKSEAGYEVGCEKGDEGPMKGMDIRGDMGNNREVKEGTTQERYLRRTLEKNLERLKGCEKELALSTNMIADLKEEVTKLRKHRGDLLEEKGRLAGGMKELGAKLAQKEEEMEKARSELKEERGKGSLLRKEIHSFRSELRQVKTRSIIIEDHLEEKRRESEGSTAALQNRDKEIWHLRRQLKELGKKSDREREEKREMREKAESLRKEGDALRRQLKDTLQDLKNTRPATHSQRATREKGLRKENIPPLNLVSRPVYEGGYYAPATAISLSTPKQTAKRVDDSGLRGLYDGLRDLQEKLASGDASVKKGKEVAERVTHDPGNLGTKTGGVQVTNPSKAKPSTTPRNPVLGSDSSVIPAEGDDRISDVFLEAPDAKTRISQPSRRFARPSITPCVLPPGMKDNHNPCLRIRH